MCPDLGRSTLYKNSIESTLPWMASNNTAPILAMFIDSYLCACGTQSMANVAPPSIGVDYALFVKYQYIIGWQNFIKSRCLSYMIEIQQEYISNHKTWHTDKTRARVMIE